MTSRSVTCLALAGIASAASASLITTSANQSIRASATAEDRFQGVPDPNSSDEDEAFNGNSAISGPFNASVVATADTTEQLVQTTATLSSLITPTHIEGTGSIGYEADVQGGSMSFATAGGDSMFILEFVIETATEVEFIAAIDRSEMTGVSLFGPSVFVGIGEQGPSTMPGTTISYTGILQPGAYLINAITLRFGAEQGVIGNTLPAGVTSDKQEWSFSLRVIPAPATAAPLLGLGLFARRRR
ncbi:MAG: hypothetical protein AAGK04_05315 [Planctomycetota bacterium]